MRVAIVGIPWYKMEAYEALLAVFADRELLPATHEEWLKNAEHLVDQFRRNGQAFQKVYIDPKTFPAWCAARGLNVDSQARIRFANESVAGKHSDEQR